MKQLPAGHDAAVRVPATSANLGPGFDAMGLALDWYDSSRVEVLDEGWEFELSGEGCDQVPRDAGHLVVRTLLGALAELGHGVGGLRLTAHNTIPHSRGLGSSAAAIVAGLGLAWGLARPGEELDLDWACQRSSALEGHPDNACAAVLGGGVLAWQEAGRCELVHLELVDELAVRVYVPSFEVATSGARGVLPDSIPRSDAVAQAGHAALLVHALARDPARLLQATNDHLHQPYRAALMRPSADLVASLRSAGVAAVISGAGPTVLALGTSAQLVACDALPAPGFAVHQLAVGQGAQLLAPR